MDKDKIYFASDFHLGTNGFTTSKEREEKIVRWLDYIKEDCKELYLVGDLFDYWFEYSEVIPKGYLRFISKLVEFRNLGIDVFIFTGNHDMWMFDYFKEELGIPIYNKPILKKIGNHQFFIGHGDGLGPSDYGYKFIKRVFSNKICQWLFATIHPNIGIKLMRFFSKSSRDFGKTNESEFKADKEWLVYYVEHHSTEADYFVFGHRHLPIVYQAKKHDGKYYNLGDWLYYCSYGMYDGKSLKLEFFESPNNRIYGT